jgi:protein-tyrosine phosphatase
MTQTRILFVCQGNIIRSPLAEHIFRYLAEESDAADRYLTDSAGTSGYHVGESPDARMREVAARHGFQYDGRARQVRVEDFDEFDLLIAMDTANLTSLKRMVRNDADLAKLSTMRTYDPKGGPGDSVPDPYYGGIDGFEITFQIVKRASQGLLDALEQQQE